MGIAGFGEQHLNSGIVLREQAVKDMTPDPNIELSMLALRLTIVKMRRIEKNEMTGAEFREWSTSAMTQLNKVTDYMRLFKESLRKRSEALEQTKG
jgi:hypothetical protein